MLFRSVADSQILSTKVDGTLFVVRAGVTKKDDVQSSISALKKVNANIIIIFHLHSSSNIYFYYYQ